MKIENLIYRVKGLNVMFDSDLADLYDVETRSLNQAVKRNIERFPNDFMFQLNQREFTDLKSQFVISSWGGRRTLPYVFTEQGVAMLSSVLNSKRAIQVNIQIMRTFVKLREILSSNKRLEKRLNDLEKEYDERFKIIFDAIKKLMLTPTKNEIRKIGFRKDS